MEREKYTRRGLVIIITTYALLMPLQLYIVRILTSFRYGENEKFGIRKSVKIYKEKKLLEGAYLMHMYYNYYYSSS